MTVASSDIALVAERSPRVSIGMPIYNGAAYLARTLDSLLAQTMSDFELVICDNASTDGTEDICRDYAARDRRIRYVRNDRNLGAGPNYDKTFHLSRGEFFKWHAHDDLLTPDYLEKAVAALDAEPAAVLWASEVTIIGPNDEVIEIVKDELPGIHDPRPSRRFAAMMLPHGCTPFFGLFRRAALEGTQLHGTYSDSDRVLLAEVALRGRVIYHHEPIFLNRDHPARYTARLAQGAFDTRLEALQWLDTSRAPNRRELPNWTALGAYLRAVRKWATDPAEAWSCNLHLVTWVLTTYAGRNLVTELIWYVNPDLLKVALKVKRALFGIRPKVTRPGG